MKVRRKINRQIKSALILSLILVSFYFTSILLAKYKVSLSTSHAISSRSFYFNSDIASSEDITYYKNWDGISDVNINFNVKNYENTYLYTSNDIDYQVSVDKLNDDNDEVNVGIYHNNDLLSGKQKLSGGKMADANYILKISKNKANLSMKNLKLKLVIKSSSPYVKELSRIIQLDIIDAKSEVSLSDKGDYVKVEIKLNGDDSDKSISYDNAKLVLDKSLAKLGNINVSSNSNINKFTLKMSGYAKDDSCYIYFIKKAKDSKIELGQDIVIS